MSGRRRGGGGEMGGGVGVARNKRGTPMYSREDIREQYCINDKELHALEASRRKPIFGCLTSSNTQPSPCKKKSLLPACLRGRVPSDENVYSKTQSAHTSPAHRKGQDTIDYEDDNYFRRRPKTICYTDPKRLSSIDDSLSKSGRVSRPRSDAGNSSYESYLDEEDEGDPSRRPTQLSLTSGEYHSTEFYQDEDNHREGYTVRRTAFTQPNTPDLGHSTRFHQVNTPEAFLDDRPQKHVSFQKAMSRSATVGGLEDHGSMTRDDSGRGSVRSGGSRSQERLLDGRRTPDYVEQRALDQLLAPVLTKALLQEPGRKRERKHGGEDKKRSGSRQVDSEAGSRSGSRSSSRTPSLRRKKVEKRTIGIQTDDLPEDFDFPEGEGEILPKHLDNQGSKRELQSRSGHKSREGHVSNKESLEGDKKSGKHQKKSKKKTVEEEVVVPQTPTRKGSVHFSDETDKNVHIVENVEVSEKPMKTPKKKSENKKDNSHSTEETIGQGQAKATRKHVKDNNHKFTDTEIKKDTNHETRHPDNTKVSMGMQTDSLVPFLPTNSIFMTEDLDTSTDWHGEESSVDWQASSGSLWHTDASSFAWHTDASSYCRQTPSSLSCRADNSSFAPDSCEEMAEESDEGENMMNMDIDLIRERRLDKSLNQENIVCSGDVQDNVTSESCAAQNIAIPFQKEVENRYLDNIENENFISEEEVVQRNELGSQEETDTNFMVRRLRFRRQLAEEFLQQNMQAKVQDSHENLPQQNVLEEEVVEKERRPESNQCPKEKETVILQKYKKENYFPVSTFPRKIDVIKGSSKEDGDAEEMPEIQKEMIPLETSRTWPKSFVEQERSDDINLKGFQALSEAHTGTNRKKREEKPDHKTSWLEINLVKREVERTETPKCVQISNSQLNKNTESDSVNPKRDLKIKKKEQQADISDEYPKSDHDYKPHVSSGSLPLKKSSPRTDSSKSPQRRKKITQKESSDSSTSHQLEMKKLESRKLKDVTKASFSKLKETLTSKSKANLPSESPRMSSSTDTGSALPSTDSAGRKMKKSKKAVSSSHTKEEELTLNVSRTSSNTHLKKVIEEEVEVRELPLQGSEMVIDIESSKMTDGLKSGSSSLRRKRSLRRRKSICIQTEFSYDEPQTDQIENVTNESIKGKTNVTDAPQLTRREVVNTPDHATECGAEDNKELRADLKSETVSVVTNASSLHRMRKLRKATTSTQTDDLIDADNFLDMLQQENQIDSVSIRTSSLRRIRRAEKKSVEIQTEVSLPIYYDNLHLSILDFEEFKEVGMSGHSDSLIYVNIPAAFLEIGESGNDADISDADSEDENAGEKIAKEKIYSRLTEKKSSENSENNKDRDHEDNVDKNIDIIEDEEENIEVEFKSKENRSDEKLSCVASNNKDMSVSERTTHVTSGMPTSSSAEEDGGMTDETYTITDENLTIKPIDEEDTSDEDEDFDIYIVDCQNGEKKAEDTSGKQLTTHEVEKKNSDGSDTNEDEDDQLKCKSNEENEGGEREDCSASSPAKKKWLSLQKNVDINLSRCHQDQLDHSQKNRMCKDSPGPATSDENSVNNETSAISFEHEPCYENPDHDSGVSEEEIKDTPDEGLVAERWYFGVQDKTFELVEGSEDTKRQDTVIYCPADGVEDTAKMMLTSAEGYRDEELITLGDEESRISMARKSFREMRYPYGKGHFSEGDTHQALVFSESIDDVNNGSIEDNLDASREIKSDANIEEREEDYVKTEGESLDHSNIERTQDKIDIDQEAKNDTDLETEEKKFVKSESERLCDTKIESVQHELRNDMENNTILETKKEKNPIHGKENIDGSSNANVQDKLDAAIEMEYDADLEKKKKDCLEPEKDSMVNSNNENVQILLDEALDTEPTEERVDEKQSSEEDVAGIKTLPLSVPKDMLENVAEIASCAPEIRVHEVLSFEEKLPETPTKERKLEHKGRDTEFIPESGKDDTNFGEEYDSKCEEESCDIGSASITTRSEDESYRDGSPCSTRSGSEYFRDKSPSGARYDHQDAISIAMASEYGYTISEEEDDEVIVFSYKKVRKTREEERWKSRERMVNKGVEKAECLQNINREHETLSVSQAMVADTEGKEKEVRIESEENNPSVKPKRKRSKKKKEIEYMGELVVEDKAKTEENKEDDVDMTRDDQEFNGKEVRKEAQMQKKKEPQSLCLPQGKDIPCDKHLVERKNYATKVQLAQREQIQKEDAAKEQEIDIKPTEIELKKKKRPRYRKKKNKPVLADDAASGAIEEQSNHDKTKIEIDSKNCEEYSNLNQKVGYDTENSQGKKHRLWADEIEENLSKEWRSCESDKVASNGSLKEQNKQQTSELSGVEFHDPQGEKEEDTSCYEDEDNTSHYDEDSSQYEEDSVTGEGGGEQNAYEEYLLIEGDYQEEMKEVDRIFQNVFKDYGEEFLADEDDLNQLQKEGMQDQCEMDFNRICDDSSKLDKTQLIENEDLGACDVSSILDSKVSVEGNDSVSIGKSAYPQGDNTEKSGPPERIPRTKKTKSSSDSQPEKSKPPEKIPRSKNSKKFAPSQAKRSEDFQPSDNIEG